MSDFDQAREIAYLQKEACRLEAIGAERFDRIKALTQELATMTELYHVADAQRNALKKQPGDVERGGDDVDDDDPLWLVNEQIKGLLEGDGATEDHEDVLKFLRSTGLPEGTVKRIHKAIVFGDSKVAA